MTPSARNSSSSRRSTCATPARRAPSGLRNTSSSSTGSSPSSDGSSPYASAGYAFTSPTPLQIRRTINITVEISSGTATANNMDVSQYHMPVTTSCYSQTSGSSYEYQSTAPEYETATEYSSQQGPYPFIPSTTTTTTSSSSHEKSSDYWTQRSASEPEYLNELSEDLSSNKKNRQEQHEPDINSTHTLSNVPLARLSMLDCFLAVDSREDALVVEARAAIAEGRVRDENENVSRNLYGWESAIDDLLKS